MRLYTQRYVRSTMCYAVRSWYHRNSSAAVYSIAVGCHGIGFISINVWTMEVNIFLVIWWLDMLKCYFN